MTAKQREKKRQKDIQKWVDRGVCMETAITMADCDMTTWNIFNSSTGPKQPLLSDERHSLTSWL